MTVVLAGCGDVGTQVALELLAAGHRVLGLRRSTHALPSAVTARSVDLAAEVPQLPDDTETVVVATAADGGTVEDYRRAYLSVVANITRAVRTGRASPRRVLFVSSTGVYGGDDGRWVDERTPTRPATATASVLLEAERYLHAELPGATVLRLAGIYGPGRTGLVNRVRQRPPPIPDHPRWTNRIHRDDAAAAIVHLTTATRRPAPLYVGTDDCPAERGQVIRYLAGELGVPPPTMQRASEAPGGKRCRNTLLRSSGYSLRYPTYREGYRAVLTGHGIRHG